MEDDLASEAGQEQDKDPLLDLEDSGAVELDESDLNEDVSRLRSAWRNEVSAPELLSLDEQLVDDLMQQVQNQQAIVDDARGTPEEAFSASLYQMELDRLRYSLSKYLRTRLRKVERDAMHVLSVGEEEMEGRLSDRERKHAQEYVDMLEDHFGKTCLNQMPSNFRSLTNTSQEENMVQEPNLDTFVVCRAKEDVGLVQIGEASGRDDRSMNLRGGDMFIVRYRPIRTLVLEGRVDLI